ncbi:MAG: histidine triad nucleotide-binding protein [Candidatus Acidiferrales bacterium]|jgi:histidine triad (HIT) family protein
MGTSDCLFCRIARKEIPAKLVYEDDEIFAFEDINPQAPDHILICPRRHLESLSEAVAEDAALLGRILLVGAKLAKQRKRSDFRAVFNNGPEAGQSVFHLHLHLLGGRAFSWPPG